MCEKIIGKLMMKGIIRAISPLHIGCDSDERSDDDVLRDRNGNPFIPATSFIGILRHAIHSSDTNVNIAEEQLNNFWGYTDERESEQSAIKCSDLICVSHRGFTVRDGILINNVTGIVEPQKKYDYELVERGSEFKFSLEITMNDGNASLCKQIAATILFFLSGGTFFLGAKTNNGMGQLVLKQETLKIYQFKFSEKRDVKNWLNNHLSPDNEINIDDLGIPFEITQHNFKIELKMSPKNSFIVRSYPNSPSMPDAVHISSQNQPILPGTSIKGALRARAERIVRKINQMNPKVDMSLVHNLFGNVDDKDPTNNPIKGRIRIHESVLPDFVAELQHRIKIDRFTGGTIEGALFDSMPLFQGGMKKRVILEIEVQRCSLEEAGLLTLLLKDLWTADLPIGGEKGIGRGVFIGKGAVLSWNDEQFILTDDLTKIPEKTREKLQSFVDSLVLGEAQ